LGGFGPPSFVIRSIDMNDDYSIAKKNYVKATLEAEAAYENGNERAMREADYRWERAYRRKKQERLESREG